MISVKSTISIEIKPQSRRKILQIHLSDGIEQLGGINWQLLLCMFLSWFVCYLCICKGVKTSGKVTLVTSGGVSDTGE